MKAKLKHWLDSSTELIVEEEFEAVETHVLDVSELMAKFIHNIQECSDNMAAEEAKKKAKENDK